MTKKRIDGLQPTLYGKTGSSVANKAGLVLYSMISVEPDGS